MLNNEKREKMHEQKNDFERSTSVGVKIRDSYSHVDLIYLLSIFYINKSSPSQIGESLIKTDPREVRKENFFLWNKLSQLLNASSPFALTRTSQGIDASHLTQVWKTFALFSRNYSRKKLSRHIRRILCANIQFIIAVQL